MKFADISILDSKVESTQFADIYFSPENGVAESQYNFIEANLLDSRFNDNDFYIGETGFGSGHNFLLTLALWRKRKQGTATLYYFSSEKYPIEPKTLAKLYQNQTEFSNLGEEGNALLQFYQPENSTLTIYFQQWQCQLCILLGDNSEVYKNLAKTTNITIDAWYLDGFAPARNPEMWQADFFTALRQLSKFGTTVSSFTVAAIVKKPLLANGFTVNKKKGFAQKREMLYAELKKDCLASTSPLK